MSLHDKLKAIADDLGSQPDPGGSITPIYERLQELQKEAMSVDDFTKIVESAIVQSDDTIHGPAYDMLVEAHRQFLGG